MPTLKTLTLASVTNRKNHDNYTLLTTSQRATTGVKGAAVATATAWRDNPSKQQKQNQNSKKRATEHHEKRPQKTRRPITETPESTRPSAPSAAAGANRPGSIVLGRISEYDLLNLPDRESSGRGHQKNDKNKSVNQNEVPSNSSPGIARNDRARGLAENQLGLARNSISHLLGVVQLLSIRAMPEKRKRHGNQPPPNPSGRHSPPAAG